MTYLIGLIVALVGGFLFQRAKAKNAGALLENLDVLKDLQKNDTQISKDQGLLQAEEEKRKALQNAPKESLESLNDFFNKK